MGSTTSFLIVIFGYLAFGISVIIWISRKKKAGEKISLRAKIIIAVILFSSSSALISTIEPAPTPETNVPEASTTYYVKVKSANVRECPSTSCRALFTLPQNNKLIFLEDTYNKYPDWVRVDFDDGTGGYISKTVLSENTVPESQLMPTDDSSSTGGITIGPWSDIQTKIGESYEIPFCEPPSAISGATCGALADTTTDPRGGTPPYSFIKKSGFLPPGMTLELNGTLKGAPTQEGTYNFRLCAKDLYGGEGCQDLAVVVKKKESSSFQSETKSVEDHFIKIDSAECKFYNDERNKVVSSGSAGGPVGMMVGIGLGPINWYDSPSPPFGISCSSWTKNGSNRCKRGSGDPPTTTWTMNMWVLYTNRLPSREETITLEASISGGIPKTVYDKFDFKCLQNYWD